MRSDGQVLLVSCFEMGRQPLSLAWPLAFLTAAGFEADAIDLTRDRLDSERVMRAQLICVSTPMHTALRLGMSLLERIRALGSDAHVCFFGLYASLNADVLFAAGVDSAVGGESEGALVRLAQALERGSTKADGVATPSRPAPPSLERLRFPTPSRSRLPSLDRYAALSDGDASRIAGSVEASRGCKHLCRHCPVVPVYGGRFIAVPAEVVLADARQQVDAGARHLSFGDPDFLNGPTHALRIARSLHREFPELSFDATVKVEHLLQHPEIVAELPSLGCAFIISAFESVTDEVLRNLRKGHTRVDLDRVMDLADDAGLPLRPTFVPFTPWSDLDDYLQLVEWIESRDLVDSVDPVQLAIRLLVPPGSHLLELPAIEGWPGPLDRAQLSHRWTHRDLRLDTLQKELAKRIEAGASQDEDAHTTFASVRALAYEASGSTPRPQRPLHGPRRDRPPRLAENWFC